MKPLTLPEIRDLDREINEKLLGLKPLSALVVVKSMKKGRCYGIGFNDPKTDLILRNLVRFMGGLYRPKPLIATFLSVTLYDKLNTPSTIVIHKDTAHCLYGGLGGSMLSFGNPPSAPTPQRTDYELASLVSTITPSSTETDETNWRVTTTGSYVWSAGGTVREAGKYLNLYDSVRANWYLFLIYHDAVEDVIVPPYGTVSVTYKTQF